MQCLVGAEKSVFYIWLCWQQIWIKTAIIIFQKKRIYHYWLNFLGEEKDKLTLISRIFSFTLPNKDMQSSDENTDIIKKALYIVWFGVKIQLVCLWKACLGLVMLMMRKGGKVEDDTNMPAFHKHRTPLSLWQGFVYNLKEY